MSKNKLHNTKNSLSTRTRAQSVALLNVVLAELSDLYSQTKQAHWNVRGRNFYTYHTLFDTVADSAEEHVDDVAERVAQLGGYAEGTVRMAAKNSRLKEWPTDLDKPDEFVSALVSRFATVANSVRDGIDAASRLGDADTADLFTEISRKLDKSLWFLEASK